MVLSLSLSEVLSGLGVVVLTVLSPVIVFIIVLVVVLLFVEPLSEFVVVGSVLFPILLFDSPV